MSLNIFSNKLAVSIVAFCLFGLTLFHSIFFHKEPGLEKKIHTTQVRAALESRQIPLIDKSHQKTLQKTFKSDNTKKHHDGVAAKSAADFDNLFHDNKVKRIHADGFGNYYANLSEKGNSIRRYLVSDWPIYYPTPQEKRDGTVSGCMSLNYYVSLDANISLVIEENSLFRMHHFICQYDYALQEYRLESMNVPAFGLMDSIQSVVNEIQFSRQP